MGKLQKLTLIIVAVFGNLFFNVSPIFALKILHLSFHSGCINDFLGVANELNLDVTSWYIHNMEPYAFDPLSKGSSLYNIGHDRAERIYNLHKDFFETFDVILTSDTAPLSRIFLQNDWKKPLIIWVCNRFDYCDVASLDCDFPDQEYYDLFEKATHLPNVSIVAYNDYERHYCNKKGIDIGSLTIKPCIFKIKDCNQSSIPNTIDKKNTFFLPPYHNENIFMDLKDYCDSLKIPTYRGRYNGPGDLKGFKGIIHLPYAWSNLALFENVQLEIPYFLPSIKFINFLKNNGNYFFVNSPAIFTQNIIELSEWYGDEFKEIFTYFDSWEDLIYKTQTTDFDSLKEKIKVKAIKHRETTLDKWKDLINSFENYYR